MRRPRAQGRAKAGWGRGTGRAAPLFVTAPSGVSPAPTNWACQVHGAAEAQSFTSALPRIAAYTSEWVRAESV